MLAVVVAVAALSAATLGYVAVSILMRRSAVERTLAELDHAAIDADRREELGVFAKVVDEKGRSRLERRLTQAGWYEVTPGQFLRRSVMCSLGGFGLAVFASWILHRHDLLALLFIVLLPLCAGIVPNSLLDSAIAERKRRIRNALPDFLDLVSTTVEAGIALNGAIATATDAVRGPLREELLAVLSDIRVGRSRAEALAAMSARCDVVELTTAITAIVQAEKLGGDVAAILDQLAHESRDHRMMRAEELAAQLPVKMTFPMALCMLPALFVMIFGAVLAQLLSK